MISLRATLRPILDELGESPRPEQILDLRICDPAMGSGAFLVEVCRQLGDRIVKAWHAHRCLPPIPPDEDEFLHARRLVAQRCLYGVDRNPLAANLAKLSLWLATLAKDHAFTFLDHALRHGDSLVGLSREQLAAFHWAPATQLDTLSALVAARIERAVELRRRIQTATEGTADVDLREWLRDADEALHDARMVGDVVVAAFFREEKAKARERARRDLATQVEAWLGAGTGVDELRSAAAMLGAIAPAVTPFHWELEFPEVFVRGAPGFDAIVGNPPFGGKNVLVNSNAPGFLDWLKTIHEETHGNADLVTHFFRRAFTLLRSRGSFGLLATKTIRQGDTRATGLRWLCSHGGTIYRAERRLKWPGEAAVIVSVVHILKGPMLPPFDLDGRAVPIITAYLFHDGGNESPAALGSNVGKAFIGSYVLGMGFTFDDTDRKGAANPTSLMRELIAANPKTRERILPYIGGEEVNDSPTHAHHRYVINFGDMTEEQARRQWPALMAIVERKVRPSRTLQGSIVNPERWWMFARPATDLQHATSAFNRVLVIARVGDKGAFTFLPSDMVYSEQLVVIAVSSYAAFCTVQSRIHEVWARFFASSMKDDLRYTPSDCFETFPFSENWESDPRLEPAGKAYYELRAALLVKSNEGLTKTYNRFHDPEEQSPEIVRLRELHATMDRAVLAAYGWTDIQPTCKFLLDYEEAADVDEGEDGGKSRRRPWRYRWPDDVHDEVLARLLALNRERAEAERLAGAAVQATSGKGTRRKGGGVRSGREGSQSSFLTE